MGNPGITLPPRPPPLLGPSRRTTRDLCVNLARLFRAGISLQDALTTLRRGSEATYVGQALEDVGRAVEGGSTLADALARHPRLFRRADVQVVRAAERLGELGPAFDAVAEAIDGWLEARGRMLKSSVYPLIVLCSSIVLLPIPMAVTAGAGAYAAEVFTGFAWLAAAGAAFFFGVPWLLEHTRLGVDLRRLAWRAPWPASVYRDHVRATFYGVLARNLESGLLVYESLRSAGTVTADEETEAAAERSCDRITAGDELGEALVAEGLVPVPERMMVLAGERSGTLPEALHQMAQLYRDRAARGMGRVLTAVGAVLTVIVFAFVAAGILDAWRELNRSTGQVFDLIEKEMPYLR